MYNVRVREKEGKRREGPKGMEKPIPSYQRKWLLADRKKCYAFSAEDDNNKHFTIGELQIEVRELLLQSALNPCDISISAYPLSTSRIMDHLGSLSSQMRTGITYNAARMNFSVFLARLSAR